MYAELECQSHYSFLKGASSPEELVTRASEIGLQALALTDEGGVYGLPKAYWATRSFPSFHLLSGSRI